MTDVRQIASGQQVSADVLASADQATIFGDGSAANPLRASGGTTFRAELSSGSGDARVGGWVAASSAAPSGDLGVDVSVVVEIGLPIVGVVVGVAGAVVTVQGSGSVTLPTSTWDDVTGQVGGLTPGTAYFAAGSVPGNLTTTPPSTPGAFVAQIGVAVSARVLALDTPVVPAENP